MKVQERKLTRAALLIVLGCFVLNSVVLADLAKTPTAQYSVDSFSQQRVFQPSTTSAVGTYPSEILANLPGNNSRIQSGSRILDRYVHNSWSYGIIDQATAEKNAIVRLKQSVTPLNFDDFQLSYAKLVNSLRGKEYVFEWKSKPNGEQTNVTLRASVNAKTGMVTHIWVES
jgi:hypothetical protein